MSAFYSYNVRNIDGSQINLSDYKGKVVLAVNVASKCGFTPQYKGLEALYQRHQADGFVILGFPCNQFGAQEPGDSAEIAEFCSLNYDVSFPLTEKVEVNGANAHPFYDWVKAEQPGFGGSKSIKWNFTKFLIDRDGNVVTRFGPRDTPEKIGKLVAKLI